MAERVPARVAEPVADDWVDWRSLLRRRGGLIIAVLLATVSSAYVTVQFVLSERYETKARLLLKVGRENSEAPATVQKSTFVSSGVRREELNSEIQMLTAPTLIAEVVDRLGPDVFRRGPPPPAKGWRLLADYMRRSMQSALEGVESLLIVTGLKKKLTDREKFILAIERSLKAEVEMESQVIAVKLQLPDPDLGVRLLDVLLQLYLGHHIEVWRAANARDFFTVQVEDRRRHVRDVEAAREALKAKWNLVAVGEQRTLLLRQADAVKSEIETNEAKKAALRAQEQAMRARLEALPDQLRQSENVTPNPLIQTRKERLALLEQERTRRLTVYNRDSQPIKNIEQEIVKLRELLADEAPTVVGSVTLQANPLKRGFLQSIEEIRVQIDGLDSSTRQHEARAARLEDRLREINAADRQLRELDREYQMAEENYLLYTKRMEEGRVSEELDQRRVANVSILGPPVRPIEPVFPRKILTLILSVPIGLLLGVALALFVEYTSDVVTTPRDPAGIEGVAYLGTLRL